MKVGSVKKTLTYGVLFVGFLNVLNFVYMMGMGGGVKYKDVYTAFEEIEDLENRNLLHNPPETLSKDTQEIMQYLQSSGKPVNAATAKEYMYAVEDDLHADFVQIFILFSFFILTLITRICMIFFPRFKTVP